MREQAQPYTRPLGDQAIEGRLICFVSVVLPENGLVRCKAEPCEGADDVFACAWNVPGRVDVLDANEPDAVVGARIEKARHSSDKTACMKGACGRGGKTASVGRHGAGDRGEDEDDCRRKRAPHALKRSAPLWALTGVSHQGSSGLAGVNLHERLFVESSRSLIGTTGIAHGLVDDGAAELGTGMNLFERALGLAFSLDGIGRPL